MMHFSDTDKWDSFIKIWIAIEMAFIEKEKACNVLKDIMVEAFKMNHQEINKYFMINHIYGLRKKIIHNGYFPNFDHRLLELLGNIYRDLLSWKLSGICPKSSLLYLENNEIVISELFKDSLKK